MKTGCCKFTLLTVIFLSPKVALAAEDMGAGGVGISDLLTLLAGLIFVLVLILGCAWLIKRMGGISGANSGVIKVLAVLPVGSRERLALVEVGEQQLLLGITAQQITTLHSFSDPLPDITNKEINSEFAQKLHQLVTRK